MTVSVPDLTYDPYPDLSSSRVDDTLDHTPVPFFSVDSKMCFFAGHADSLGP